MTLSRRELLSAGAASLAVGFPVGARNAAAAQTRSAGPAAKRGSRLPNLPIREYLAREARHITDNALADLKTPADFERQLAARRRQYMQMLGLGDLPSPAARGPVPYKVTGVVERRGYRIEKLHYESLPNLHVTANLYIPAEATAGARRPGVLYVCGHAANQKVYYQGHPKRFAELGFPTLIVETVQLGEVTGFHHGCYREGWFQWYSRGYSPAAIEVLNGIRGLDLLASRPEVDAERLGVTGISGGGAMSWYITAADERVKVCSPVCGTATLASHVYDRVIDGHCDCMWWINTAKWDLADIGALIAPRPLLIASANQDGIFPIHAIREVNAQLEGLYRTLDVTEHLKLVETPGGHSYHELSRTAIFSWFLQHLAGRRVTPEEVGDIETDPATLETIETLRVYAAGPPPGNRIATIHDELIAVAQPPAVRSAATVGNARQQLVAKLRADTFNHFPRTPPPLDIEEEFALDGGDGTRFAFTSEDGWRLHGLRRNPRTAKGPNPVVVVLRSPGEARGASETFASSIRRPWTTLVVETRGTGDTSWGEDLNWHVRRASAWSGRTIASMRVWDALRAIEAARALPGVDSSQISIAARGEMGAVALYAALLDGRLSAVLLDSPPATQNVPGTPDGKGPAIEMLNCLRYTDLPQVAGLLHPAQIVIAGAFPQSYAWAEQLYGRMTPPGSFQRVVAMSEWSALQPAPRR
jgi:cephalosporin-C deacetylase-like acetyl esterase